MISIKKYIAQYALTAIGHGLTVGAGVVCFNTGLTASNRVAVMKSRGTGVLFFLAAHHDVSLPRL